MMGDKRSRHFVVPTHQFDRRQLSLRPVLSLGRENDPLRIGRVSRVSNGYTISNLLGPFR